jgi:hypothetical protein
MAPQPVLNLRQIADNTVHDSVGIISSHGDIQKPTFATSSVLGNIGAPLRGMSDDEERTDEGLVIEGVEERRVFQGVEGFINT